MNVSVAYLVKDPPLDRLAAQVEYLREIADEFVFSVDDRTDPETIDIIQSWPGVKTTMITWRNDFAWARNQALPLITNPWTLHVDPDELPTYKAITFIKGITEPGATKALGYQFWTPNWWGGIKGTELPFHWHVRMFKSGHGLWYRKVHELVMLDRKQEGNTRGSICPPAPRDAYIIHSKAADRFEVDQALYTQIERG